MPNKIWKSAPEVFDHGLQFRYRGTYDYDGLILLLRDFYNYMRCEKPEEPKFKYKDKGNGAEVEFKMFGDAKVSAFTKVAISIKGFMWNVYRGKPTTGRIQITIQAQFAYDYAGEFNPKLKSHRLMRRLIQDEKTIRGVSYRDLELEGELHAEALGMELLDRIKRFIGVECV